jgi:hypothetical protein
MAEKLGVKRGNAGVSDDLTLVIARLQNVGGAMLEAALAYARLGVPVFPCHPNTKRPLVAQGFYAATLDLAQIAMWWRKWPAAMIGVPTGRTSGFLVVDLDPAPDQSAHELLAQLRAHLRGNLPAGLVAHTPRGGMHLVFAIPEGVAIGNRANLLRSAKEQGTIDIRADGGYIIAPPSQRRGSQAEKEGCDGKFYIWDQDEGPGEDFALPSASAALLALLTNPVLSPRPRRPRTTSSKTQSQSMGSGRERRYALKALGHEIDQLARQLKGQRNDRLNIASMKLAQLVAAGALSEAEVRRGLEDACGAKGLTSDSGIAAVRATIASGFRKGCNEPRDLAVLTQSPASASHDGRRGRAEAPVTPDAPVGEDRRPVIRIRPSLLHESVDRAEKILLETGPGPLYQRSGQLVQITDRPAFRSNGARENQKAIAFAERAFFSRTLAQRARCERYVARDQAWIPCDPKPELAEQYFSIKQWKLPILRQLVSSPTLRHDGTLLHRQGYDAATGLYLTEELPGLDVPHEPTEDDAQRANETLTSFISSFPYADPPGRVGQSLAVAMAGLLSACSRAALELAPIIVVTAPASGTGKSYMVDVSAVIATGSRATCVATGGDPEELEKSVGAELINGRPFVLLDNLVQPLQGALLCQLMSQPTVELRDLGRSRNITLSAGVSLYATGNNVQVKGDMTRRVLVCTLDARMEHPETRSFDHDLLEEAKRRRVDLVSAALTILRWRFCWRQDTPGPWQRVAELVPHAGFTEWSDRIRKPLMALGHADPVLSIEQARLTDGEADVLGALLETWQIAYGDEEKTCRQAIDHAQGELRDAIKAATRERDDPTPAKLGNYLGRVRDRPCIGKRFVATKVVRGNRFWQVI